MDDVCKLRFLHFSGFYFFVSFFYSELVTAATTTTTVSLADRNETLIGFDWLVLVG